MKKLATIAAALLLCNPAFAAYMGDGKGKQPPVDAQCDKFANFAKSLATLKEVGFSLDGTKQFVAEPTVSPYPIHFVRTKVYAMTGTPEEVYKEFYSKCTFTGYDTLVKMLVEEEQVVKENDALKKELADLKATVALAAQQAERLKNTRTVKAVAK